MTAATDAELMSQAQSAPAAFERLVLRHHDAIHRYVARRLGAGSADDVVSEVFTTAYAIRARYDSTRPNARPWLFGIATNMIRRHARREAEILDAYARSGVHPEMPDQAHHDDELGPALAAALATMRKEHRDVLTLHALADLSYEEIAQALDVPIGTVRGWLHRARAVAARELAARGLLPPSPGVNHESEVVEP